MRGNFNDGRQTERLALILLPPIVAAITITATNQVAFIFAIGYLIGTYWLSPDLDLKGSVRCRVWWRWHRAGLSWVWLLYPGLVGCHRSWLSHAIVIGTAVRLAYLLWLPTLVAILAGINLAPALAPAAIAILGIEAAAIVHYFRDGFEVRIPRRHK